MQTETIPSEATITAKQHRCFAVQAAHTDCLEALEAVEKSGDVRDFLAAGRGALSSFWAVATRFAPATGGDIERAEAAWRLATYWIVGEAAPRQAPRLRLMQDDRRAATRTRYLHRGLDSLKESVFWLYEAIHNADEADLPPMES